MAEEAKGPHWSLTDDKKSLQVVFPTEPPAGIRLDHIDVEDMIEKLAAMRVGMEPPMPLRDPFAGTRILAHPAGRWFLDPQPSGHIMLCILHPGIGWVGLPMTPKALLSMMEVAARVMANFVVEGNVMPPPAAQPQGDKS